MSIIISLIIIVVIIVLILIYIVHLYNNLVNTRNRVENNLSQIDVQLNRRNDLIPNLVETVKGYASHEKELFEEVTNARSKLINAGDIKDKSSADSELSGALKSVFAVAENYPELKANTNFQELQKELSDTEDKISYSRGFYNDSVLMYNNLCQQFPSNIIASRFNFKEKEYYKAPDNAKEVPKVEF